MNRKNKLVKHSGRANNKENQISKVFHKHSKKASDFGESRLEGNCPRHNTPKSIIKDNSLDVPQVVKQKKDPQRMRYSSQAQQKEKDKTQIKEMKEENESVPKPRNKTCEGRSKKEELMEWYHNMEKQYETVERHLDSELEKLNLRHSQIQKVANSRLNHFTQKRAPMGTIIEQKNFVTTNPQSLRSKINANKKSIDLTKYYPNQAQFTLFKKQTFQPPPAPSITHLLTPIKDQIELESKLRFFKHKLNTQNTLEIQKILLQTHNLLSKYCKLAAEQFDPFIKQSPQLSPTQIASEISNWYQQTCSHWKDHLKCRFSKEECRQLFHNLDFDQKGEVELKIFVRELSILLKMNLRKRDVLKIFERVSYEGVITQKSLIKEISKE